MSPSVFYDLVFFYLPALAVFIALQPGTAVWFFVQLLSLLLSQLLRQCLLQSLEPLPF